MQFYRIIRNLVDVSNVYKDVFGDKSISLGKACLEILGKDIDKSWRMSNWEKRPLKLAQMHYGALDAYCMLPLLQKMIEQGQQKEGFNFKKYVKTQSLKNQEEEAKNGEKKDKKKSNYKKKGSKPTEEAK